MPGSNLVPRALFPGQAKEKHHGDEVGKDRAYTEYFDEKSTKGGDSIRRCLKTKWWTRSAAPHLIETEILGGPHRELQRKPQERSAQG